MQFEHQTDPSEFKHDPRYSNPITPCPTPKGLATWGEVGHEPQRGSNLSQ